MDQTILGLPVATPLPNSPDYTVSPYTALAIVKGIDSDGDVVYAVVLSDDLDAIEAAGLLRYAQKYTDQKIAGMIYASTESS